ncbi:MAG: MarR family winged helix-turn-helix transcriptional regulator [Bosea sp. (in: a-proteobacteria)]
MTSAPSEATIQAWALLVKAQQVALAAVEEDVKAAGFPPLAWYDLLLELRHAEGGQLRPVELEPKLLLAQHNVSRMIDRLEAAGYAERRACPKDKRGQHVAITEGGRALLKAMWPVYRDAIQRHIGEKLACDHTARQLSDLLALITRKDG